MANHESTPLLRGEFSKFSGDDERLAFGWASIASAAGVEVVDSQADIIDAESLERAMYAYVEDSRVGATMHQKMDTATLVEAFVSTPAKLEKMGLPAGALPVGVWVGYRVHDDETWAKIKSGEYPAFSIGGIGQYGDDE